MVTFIIYRDFIKLLSTARQSLSEPHRVLSNSSAEMMAQTATARCRSKQLLRLNDTIAQESPSADCPR